MKKRTILINNLYPSLNFKKSEINQIFQALDNLQVYSIPKGELSIAFMDDSSLANIHDEFFDDPSTTDVITFEGDPSFDFAGEICISIDHAINAAEEYKTSLSHEILLYLIHGYLHLAGLDDLNENDAKKMRQGEFELLEALKKAGISPSFSLN